MDALDSEYCEFGWDKSDDSQYCQHGRFIGSWWGPDIVCSDCEFGWKSNAGDDEDF